MFSIFHDHARVDDDLGQKSGIGVDVHVHGVTNGLKFHYRRCSRWDSMQLSTFGITTRYLALLTPRSHHPHRLLTLR